MKNLLIITILLFSTKLFSQTILLSNDHMIISDMISCITLEISDEYSTEIIVYPILNKIKLDDDSTLYTCEVNSRIFRVLHIENKNIHLVTFKSAYYSITYDNNK